MRGPATHGLDVGRHRLHQERRPGEEAPGPDRAGARAQRDAQHDSRDDEQADAEAADDERRLPVTVRLVGDPRAERALEEVLRRRPDGRRGRGRRGARVRRGGARVRRGGGVRVRRGRGGAARVRRLGQRGRALRQPHVPGGRGDGRGRGRCGDRGTCRLGPATTVEPALDARRDAVVVPPGACHAPIVAVIALSRRDGGPFPAPPSTTRDDHGPDQGGTRCSSCPRPPRSPLRPRR